MMKQFIKVFSRAMDLTSITDPVFKCKEHHQKFYIAHRR